jgi:long-chain fatty acid transport protein
MTPWLWKGPDTNPPGARKNIGMTGKFERFERACSKREEKSIMESDEQSGRHYAKRRILASCCILLTGYAAWYTSAWGAGFALIEHSASGMGSAFAGAAALAEDPSTLWFNPAGMLRLQEPQVAIALHAVLPEGRYTDRGSYLNPALTGDRVVPGSLSGSNATTKVTGWVPNFYYVLPLSERYTFGIGINVPFGLETDYQDDWVGRYHATNSYLATFNINPSLAWRATKRLSFGFGLNIQFAEADLTKKIDSGALCLTVAGADDTLLARCVAAGLLPNTPENDSEVTVSGDDWSNGYNLGLLYEFTPRNRIGLSYRSEISQKLEGDSNYKVNPDLREFLDANGRNDLLVRIGASAEAKLPASASLSAVFGLSDRLSLLADITWTGWSSFKELRVVFDNPAQPDDVTDESWEDTLRYSLGLNYRESSRVWRVGVAYDETPIPDPQHRTPRIPGNNRTWLAIGLGMPVLQSVWLDLGYAHLFVDDMAVDSTNSGGYTLLGEYTADVDIFSVQATMTF